ncbi:CobW family GTP-binding protein [Microvirga sp. G4-2]|uniref:CobW family GTP-binding protein n=1 Tax=Microvirga sp. G4-2 TaxID=3434467 RepID=UPI004044B56E
MDTENLTTPPETEQRTVTVNILTGFLGSGKTSLLRRLLEQPDLKDAAVIINEFGEVGIDHLLVEEIDDEVVLLKSGCICCTIRVDLKDAILNLMERRERRQIPWFSRLVVETTGLADPAPIIATLLADPLLRHQVRVGNIVTVVDAVNGPENIDKYPESMRQAAVADRLVMSKIDLVDPDTIRLLEHRLSEINPAADIVPMDESDTPGVWLFTRDIHDLGSRTAEVSRWLSSEINHPHHHNHHHDVNRHGDVRAFVLTSPDPLDWARFALWLSMLLNRHGKDILRLKGILALENVDTPVVVQGVQHLIHKPMHLSTWPDATVATKLVIIARGLDPAVVERSFKAFVTAGKMTGGAAAA